MIEAIVSSEWLLLALTGSLHLYIYRHKAAIGISLFELPQSRPWPQSAADTLQTSVKANVVQPMMRSIKFVSIDFGKNAV